MKKMTILFISVGIFFVFYSQANSVSAAELSPTYSLWSKTFQYRYLTTSESEKNTLASKDTWEDDGVSWYAFSSQETDSVPVYRIKNEISSYFYYTTSESEKSVMTASSKWTYKDIGFYAYNLAKENTVPVYKMYNQSTKSYVFTSSPGEKTCIENTYPGQIEDKGIAFWVPSENANVSTDETTCKTPNGGPEISVGLWSYTRDSIKETPFKVEANKKYNIKDASGNIIASVDGGTITRVTYVSDKNFEIYNSIPNTLSYKEVYFEPADGNTSNMVFDIYRPNSVYDQYRGKVKIRYTDSNNIWVINVLPMELYVWGMGETTGTGPFEHTKLMTTIFRTYGYQYITWTSTKWLVYGFRIRSDSGSQIYRGYDWETTYPNIKKAAQETKGKIATYNGDVALTPYSSWSDGKTRSFEERWGSDEYPWCQSVKDPYGKHPTLSTSALETAGNHMVGLIANGSLKLAGSSYNWDYQRILKYYYTGIGITSKY